MFEPIEFIAGPRAGETVAHGELPGRLVFPDGRYLLMNEQLSDEELLGTGEMSMSYVWHPDS